MSALLLLVAIAAGEGYSVGRATADRAVLLEGSRKAWAKAAHIAWGPKAYRTTFRAQWDEAGLYVHFGARDPDPWSTMTKRDEWLWQQEVVEVFLDLDRSGRNYAEVEISPANVICDVRMVSPSPHKEMDYAWNLEGLESRVRIRRDSAGKTSGWTAVAFLPWSGFRTLPSAKSIALPPKPGDRWRFNVFRIERPGGPSAPDKGVVEAAWSPTGEASFHVPAAFRDLVFATGR